jgi:ribonuclease P protein component
MNSDFGLSKRERIKNRKDFEDIYKLGTTIFSSDKKLKSIYICNHNSASTGVLLATAVHKKSGNAVWRNRVKRIIKESFRLQKKPLVDFCLRNSLLIKIIISPNTINKSSTCMLALGDIQISVFSILKNIKELL